MQWLGDIINSMVMSLSILQEMVKDLTTKQQSCTWCAALESRHPHSFITAQTLWWHYIDPGDGIPHMLTAAQPLQHLCNTNCWPGVWFYCWWISFLRYKSEPFSVFTIRDCPLPVQTKASPLLIDGWYSPPCLHFSTTEMTDSPRSHEE